MTQPKKIRGDSILGTLPQDRQAVVGEFAQAHTLDETVKWLAADGLRVSRSALSHWLSSWAWQQQFRLVERDTLQFMRLAKERRPDLSESDLESFGNDFFQLQAVKDQDPKLFLKFRTARNKAELERLKLQQAERERVIREEHLKLEREKFQWEVCAKLLDQAALAKAAEIAGRPCSNTEKIGLLRRELFGDLEGATLSAPTADTQVTDRGRSPAAAPSPTALRSGTDRAPAPDRGRSPAAGASS
jgi:hypothetical protein